MWWLLLDVLAWVQALAGGVVAHYTAARGRARALLAGPHDAWVWNDGRMMDAAAVELAPPALTEGGGCFRYHPVTHVVAPAGMAFAAVEAAARQLPLLSCVAQRLDGGAPAVDMTEWATALRIVPPHAPSPAALLALFGAATGRYAGVAGWRLQVVRGDGAEASVDAALAAPADAEAWAAATAVRRRGLFGGNLALPP